MRNIVLIGLPGSGKSTLGKRLASVLGYRFLDTDAWIERNTGLRITQIFSGYGEPFFRAVESEAVRRTACQPGAVIATGGGVVLDEANIQALRAAGVVVFVDRSPKRIAGDIQTGHRPLLAGGVERLFELDRARRPLYLRAADLVLPNEGSEDEAVAALRQKLGHMRATDTDGEAMQ